MVWFFLCVFPDWPQCGVHLQKGPGTNLASLWLLMIESGILEEAHRPSVDHYPQPPPSSAAVISEGTAVIWAKLLNVQPLNMTFFFQIHSAPIAVMGQGWQGWCGWLGMACLCVYVFLLSCGRLQLITLRGVWVCYMSVWHPQSVFYRVNFKCNQMLRLCW